jgi:hypothetical protein
MPHGRRAADAGHLCRRLLVDARGARAASAFRAAIGRLRTPNIRGPHPRATPHDLWPSPGRGRRWTPRGREPDGHRAFLVWALSPEPAAPATLRDRHLRWRHHAQLALNITRRAHLHAGFAGGGRRLHAQPAAPQERAYALKPASGPGSGDARAGQDTTAVRGPAAFSAEGSRVAWIGLRRRPARREYVRSDSLARAMAARRLDRGTIRAWPMSLY